MKIFKNPRYDFVRWTWHALVLSWVVILAGGIYIWKNGIPKGVEFSGGTIVIMRFTETPDLDKIRGALPDGANAIVQTYGPPAANEVMVRVPDAGAESGRRRRTDARSIPVRCARVVGNEWRAVPPSKRRLGYRRSLVAVRAGPARYRAASCLHCRIWAVCSR